MPFLIFAAIAIVVVIWFAKQDDKQKAKAATAQRRRDESLNSRDLDAEIADIDRTLAAARKEKREHVESLDRGAGYIKRRQHDLDDWHHKSRSTWFGNGGKSLPRDAAFGQDTRQRDTLKHQRSVIAGAMQATRREIDRIQRQVIEPAEQRRAELQRLRRRKRT